ncbi:MAG: hypothetical protein KG003_16205 [Bacteroidetes bacterium]|nr:hypothetical protein [Bacteroidota bacterium]
MSSYPFIAFYFGHSDYYPFGSVIQSRSWASQSYRYGFNCKEKESDGTTDNYDFGARIYDGRLGKWLSTEPLKSIYPKYSAYQFSINNPVFNIDCDGNVIKPATDEAYKVIEKRLTDLLGGDKKFEKVFEYSADKLNGSLNINGNPEFTLHLSNTFRIALGEDGTTSPDYSDKAVKKALRKNGIHIKNADRQILRSYLAIAGDANVLEAGFLSENTTINNGRQQSAVGSAPVSSTQQPIGDGLNSTVFALGICETTNIPNPLVDNNGNGSIQDETDAALAATKVCKNGHFNGLLTTYVGGIRTGNSTSGNLQLTNSSGRILRFTGVAINESYTPAGSTAPADRNSLLDAAVMNNVTSVTGSALPK